MHSASVTEIRHQCRHRHKVEPDKNTDQICAHTIPFLFILPTASASGMMYGNLGRVCNESIIFHHYPWFLWNLIEGSDVERKHATVCASAPSSRIKHVSWWPPEMVVLSCVYHSIPLISPLCMGTYRWATICACLDSIRYVWMHLNKRSELRGRALLPATAGIGHKRKTN